MPKRLKQPKQPHPENPHYKKLLEIKDIFSEENIKLIKKQVEQFKERYKHLQVDNNEETE